MNLNKKEVWSAVVEGLAIEIVHWGVERGKFEPLNNGKGVWNYYVYLPETLLGKQFDDLWLPDDIVQFSKDGPKHITHSYMNSSFNIDEWHSGVTYYEKLGQVKGHRIIKIGCDFNHIWDEEREYDYNLEEVAFEAENTAKALAKRYSIKPPTI